MENFFDALCTVLADPAGKAAFLDAEGVQLLVLMLQNKLLSRFGALKVLSHALDGPRRALAAAIFVENLGLRVRACVRVACTLLGLLANCNGVWRRACSRPS